MTDCKHWLVGVTVLYVYRMHENYVRCPQNGHRVGSFSLHLITFCPTSVEWKLCATTDWVNVFHTLKSLILFFIDWVGSYPFSIVSFWLGRVSTLAATWDTHVKDMGKATCSPSSSSLTQEVTSDVKFIVSALWDAHMGLGCGGSVSLKSKTASDMILNLNSIRVTYACVQRQITCYACLLIGRMTW